MPTIPSTTAHPGNDYYVNVVTGTIQRQSNPLLAAGLLAAGFVGPFSWGDAKARSAGIQLGTSIGTSGAIPSTGLNVSNPLSGVAAIGDFFNRLTQPNTWVRVGEFVAGGLLLYLGLSAVFRGTEAQKATQRVTGTVKKTAKVASVVAK